MSGRRTTVEAVRLTVAFDTGFFLYYCRVFLAIMLDANAFLPGN